MGASQCAFLTFGSWLEDDFGFTAVTIGVVAFGLGAGELLASTSTARFTDRIGKRQSVVRGASVMVPTGVLLATALGTHVATGIALLVMYLIGFEFAVVSSLSMATNLLPGHPARDSGCASALARSAGRSRPSRRPGSTTPTASARRWCSAPHSPRSASPS